MRVELMQRLSEAIGIPGQEEAVRAVIREAVAPSVDRVRSDALGNLFAEKGGDRPGPRIMLAAHMDEIGLIVSGHDENGLLRFQKVGGIDDRVLLAKAVYVGPERLPGVIGGKPVHLQRPGERKSVVPATELMIDIGTKSREEAERLVKLGTQASFATRFSPFGEGLVKGKAFDDRVGCYTLIEVLTQEYASPVIGVFTVQEEVGLRGARVAAYDVAPDLAIVLEGTVCADSPEAEAGEYVTELGKGPALSFMDSSSIPSPRLLERIVAVAEREGIPYQWRRTLGGGNDAGAIHLTREGVPAAAISVPCRYIHTPCAVMSEADVDHTVRLVQALLHDLSQGGWSQ